jgi:hypothetical protein
LARHRARGACGRCQRTVCVKSRGGYRPNRLRRYRPGAVTAGRRNDDFELSHGCDLSPTATAAIRDLRVSGRRVIDGLRALARKVRAINLAEDKSLISFNRNFHAKVAPGSLSRIGAKFASDQERPRAADPIARGRSRPLANVTSRWRCERLFGVRIDKTGGCHAAPLDPGHLGYPCDGIGQVRIQPGKPTSRGPCRSGRGPIAFEGGLPLHPSQQGGAGPPCCIV